MTKKDYGFSVNTPNGIYHIQINDWEFGEFKGPNTRKNLESRITQGAIVRFPTKYDLPDNYKNLIKEIGFTSGNIGIVDADDIEIIQP